MRSRGQLISIQDALDLDLGDTISRRCETEFVVPDMGLSIIDSTNSNGRI